MATQLETATGRKIWGLHPNIFFLGLTSLLTDVSSEMIFTLIPLFLTNVLGTTTAIVDWSAACPTAPRPSSRYSADGLAIRFTAQSS